MEEKGRSVHKVFYPVAAILFLLAINAGDTDYEPHKAFAGRLGIAALICFSSGIIVQRQGRIIRLLEDAQREKPE